MSYQIDKTLIRHCKDIVNSQKCPCLGWSNMNSFWMKFRKVFAILRRVFAKLQRLCKDFAKTLQRLCKDIVNSQKCPCLGLVRNELILVKHELIWGALGRSGTLWSALGRSGALWDALGRSGTLWGALGRSGRSGAFWIKNRSFGSKMSSFSSEIT
jgi:hypothetical protein